jgi:hypothetical protein
VATTRTTRITADITAQAICKTCTGLERPVHIGGLSGNLPAMGNSSAEVIQMRKSQMQTTVGEFSHAY